MNSCRVHRLPPSLEGKKVLLEGLEAFCIDYRALLSVQREKNFSPTVLKLATDFHDFNLKQDLSSTRRPYRPKKFNAI